YHYYSSTSSTNCFRVSGVKLRIPSLLIRNSILISAKSFSEDVCQLILRIDKVKFDHPILNMLLDKVKSDVYMLGSGMLNVVAA
ncbi:hypothetical protein Tco_0872879, partial [Tanacetum coccineum]